MKGVIVQLNELIHRIQIDQTQRQYQRLDEALSINIFNLTMTDEGQSSTELNAEFFHSQISINCLIRMKSLTWKEFLFM